MTETQPGSRPRLSTAAAGAIRIADRFLADAPIAQQKALALAIVELVGRCEIECIAEILDVVRRNKGGVAP